MSLIKDDCYPQLILNEKISEADRVHFKSLLTKPWNLYIFRHTTLTEKSKILSEHLLRNHAGWRTTNKMLQGYIHHLGSASSKQLLQTFSLEKPYDLDLENKLNSKIINFLLLRIK